MISLENVTKKFGDRVVVNNVSLDIAEGEFFVLLGESGGGKSTIMKMINGLIPHNSGSISIFGKDISEFDLLTLRRQIGYVVQNTGLFPNMNVYQNIATVPKLLKWDQKAINDRVLEMLELVRLDPKIYLNKFPNELSGGQAQRVGVARALAADQSIILMDEPFGALDPITRSNLQDELLKIQKQLNKTIVFVTHDLVEAVKLADRIAVMEEGSIAALGTPYEIISSTSEFVKGFLGKDSFINILAKYFVKDHYTPNKKTTSQLNVKTSETMKDALNMFIKCGATELGVVDDQGTPVGTLDLQSIITMFQGETNEKE
ncbi:ABC transporter ATP-binding protein [Aedoeadaptatus pacaensis]|uniref:ABC transporter ATP-binding protein n=1 Tax=Aedoeadaptatus pacaensis TaxID=1776390 RepID=UPI000838A4BD|nr:ABC transporter ATP-binding protein [Peptoniphilus pacaensis]